MVKLEFGKAAWDKYNSFVQILSQEMGWGAKKEKKIFIPAIGNPLKLPKKIWVILLVRFFIEFFLLELKKEWRWGSLHTCMYKQCLLWPQPDLRVIYCGTLLFSVCDEQSFIWQCFAMNRNFKWSPTNDPHLSVTILRKLFQLFFFFIWIYKKKNMIPVRRFFTNELTITSWILHTSVLGTWNNGPIARHFEVFE